MNVQDDFIDLGTLSINDGDPNTMNVTFNNESHISKALSLAKEIKEMTELINLSSKCDEVEEREKLGNRLRETVEKYNVNNNDIDLYDSVTKISDDRLIYLESKRKEEESYNDSSLLSFIDSILLKKEEESIIYEKDSILAQLIADNSENISSNVKEHNSFSVTNYSTTFNPELLTFKEKLNSTLIQSLNEVKSQYM